MRRRGSAWAVPALLLAGCAEKSRLPFAPPSHGDPVQPMPTRVSSPAWDTTGARIAVVSEYDDRGRYAPGVYVVVVATGRAERVADIATLDECAWLDWSPTGDRLLMWRQRGIWILDLASRSWTRIDDGTRGVEGPRWSPDGEWVYYTRDLLINEPLQSGGLYVVDLVHPTIRPVMSRDSVVVWPSGPVSFSPDQAWLTYAGGWPSPDPGEALGHEIFVMRRDGRDRRQITFLRGEANNPQWLPDGSEIVFDFVPNDPQAVGWQARHTWAVRPDGSGLHRLAQDLNDVRIPSEARFAIDRRGQREAFVGFDPALGAGALYTRLLPRGVRRPVFNW